MPDCVYVVRNQWGQYWARAGEWIDGREAQRILKLRHHDEAINQLVELSARDIDLRGAVLRCELGKRGEPIVEASDRLTPTSAERAALIASREAKGATADADGGHDASPGESSTEDPGTAPA